MRDGTPVVDADERERVRSTGVVDEERRGPTACSEHADSKRSARSSSCKSALIRKFRGVSLSSLPLGDFG